MAEARTLEGLLVGDLIGARRADQIVSVRPEDLMKLAITEMLSYNFSQLPVVRTERDVPGVITWRAVGRVWMDKGDERHVKEYMDTPLFVSVNDPVLDLIAKVIDHDFVLVRDETKKLSGIITSTDISKEFHKIGEPFLLIGSIERGLRQLIRPYFGDDEVTLLLNGKRADCVDDLVFGELHVLLSSETIWARLGLPLEKASFNKKLNEVIEWRNKLVHSRICYLEDKQLRLVRNFERLIRDLLSTKARGASAPPTSLQTARESAIKHQE